MHAAGSAVSLRGEYYFDGLGQLQKGLFKSDSSGAGRELTRKARSGENEVLPTYQCGAFCESLKLDLLVSVLKFVVQNGWIKSG